MVTRAGLLATRNCEPRQARKGAAAAVDVCAGVGTVRVASIFQTVALTDLPRLLPHVLCRYPYVINLARQN